MNDYHRVTTLETVNAYGKRVVAGKRAWWLLEKSFLLCRAFKCWAYSLTLPLSLSLSRRQRQSMSLPTQ